MTAQTTTPAATSDQEQPWENLFGVCAAIGEDLGFNPLWLRIALGVSVLFNPVAAAVVYIWMGLAVLASRTLFPKRRTARSATQATVTPLPNAASAAEQQHELPLAA